MVDHPMYDVIFDTDPGIDDAMALLLLHALPEVNLLGITTVFGNASIENCTRNALYICERFNLPYPVYQGAGKTFLGQYETEYPDFVHGKDGLGDIGFEFPARQAESESAADFIVRSVQARAAPVTLVAVGRMTNVAQALQKAPEISDKLARVVMMGGAVNVPGNVTEFAEANIYGDPEAAAFVFDSGVPVFMVGLDATLKHRMKTDELDCLRGALGDAGEFLWQIKQCYLKFYASKGIFDGFPIHDSTAAMAMIYPELFSLRRGTIACSVDGVERGRTVFKSSEDGGHLVAVGAESDSLSKRFEAVMSARFGE